MKVIDIQEAKTNLEQYARECQSTPVIVAVEGKAMFELLPVRSDDPDFLDRLLANNAAFRRLAEERRKESDQGMVSTVEDVRKRLEQPTPLS